jgi:hypothetical protein
VYLWKLIEKSLVGLFPCLIVVSFMYWKKAFHSRKSASCRDSVWQLHGVLLHLLRGRVS